MKLEGEAYINNLAVVVFNEDGTEMLGSKWEALSGAEHSALIADVPTTKAVKARIVVLANVRGSGLFRTSTVTYRSDACLSISGTDEPDDEQPSDRYEIGLDGR